MDTYQAVYDAARSKMSNGDIGSAIESAIRDMNLSHYVDKAMYAFEMASADMNRYSIMLKPKLYIDGDMWCALYGENLQDGVAGFGESPAAAFEDFDRNFIKQLGE